MKILNNKILWLVCTLLIAFGIYSFVSANSEDTNGTEISIDFDAYSPDQEGSEVFQVLLKMSLTNYSGDVLKYGLESPEQHQQRLNYYISEFSKDIFLVSESDTLQCIDSHFERTYMDAPKRNFILNFNASNSEKFNKLLIVDQVYSGRVLELDIRK
jgi:hypothetical protein